VQRVSYGVVLAAALAGLLRSRRHLRRYAVLYLVLASHAAMTVATYGTPRFTLVVVPYLLLFAGDALLAAAALRHRRPARASLAEPGSAW
jgi:hypothetical protein